MGLSNSEEVAKAKERLNTNGLEKSFENYMRNVSPTPQTVIDGELLVAQLAKDNDPRWEEVATKLADDSSITAQTLQAYAIMQRLTPAGQLKAIQRNVDKMQQDATNRFGNRAPRIRVNEQLQQRLLSANDIESMVEAREAIYKDLVSQMPKTFGDMLDSWRYLAMLGNPRTHIRNIVGNGIMQPMVGVKNAIGTGLEKIFENKLDYKTKAVLTPGDKNLIEAGKKAYNDYKGAIENTQKYERKEFTEKTLLGRGLNKASNLNSNALDKEDFFFSELSFSRAYAQFLKANNLTPETIDDNMKKRASNYALIEAQKATFRDANAVAEWLNKLEYSNKKGLKMASFFKKAVLPFTKTPMNIIKRGIEYSPVGLIKTISYDTKQLIDGKINATTYIDNMASGLTGTGVTLLGALLTSMGLLRTKDDDKDRKQYFDEDNGEQDYSIVTDKGSYTIDWATPAIMPLSMGSELFKLFKEFDGIDGVEGAMDSVLNIISRLSDPVVETTMLSSLKDTMKSYSQNPGEWFGDLLLSTVSNYVQQLFPTLGGQIARIVDDTRRATYPNNGIVDKTIKRIMNKIPFVSKYNEPFIRRNGEVEKSEDLGMGVFGRAILNLFSPGYYSSNSVDKYDEEMYRLLSVTGNDDALPSNSSSEVTFDKEVMKFSGEQFTNWQQTRWSTEKKYVDEFIDSNKYKSMTDEERVSTIADIRSYAQKIAKKDFLDSLGKDFSDNEAYQDLLKSIDKIEDAEDIGISIYDYFDYDNNAGSKQAEKIGYLEDSNLSQKQKEYLYGLSGYKTTYAEAYAKVFGKNTTKKTTKKATTSNSKAVSSTKNVKNTTVKTTSQSLPSTLKNASNNKEANYKKAYAKVFKSNNSTAKSTDNTLVTCPRCRNRVNPVNGNCPVCGNKL